MESSFVVRFSGPKKHLLGFSNPLSHMFILGPVVSTDPKNSKLKISKKVLVFCPKKIRKMLMVLS